LHNRRLKRMQNEPFRMQKITTMVVHNKIQFEEFDNTKWRTQFTTVLLQYDIYYNITAF